MILGFPSIFVFESHLYVTTLPSIVGPFEYAARGTVGGCPQCAEISKTSYVNSCKRILNNFILSLSKHNTDCQWTYYACHVSTILESVEYFVQFFYEASKYFQLFKRGNNEILLTTTAHPCNWPFAVWLTDDLIITLHNCSVLAFISPNRTFYIWSILDICIWNVSWFSTSSWRNMKIIFFNYYSTCLNV